MLYPIIFGHKITFFLAIGHEKPDFCHHAQFGQDTML